MIIIENVLNTSAKVRYIYHISDIHIRRYEKHNEYEYIFEKLYEYLEKVKNDNSIIVITGDLLHNKDNLTPDCVLKTWLFLDKLRNIMPLFLITGNHDFVETNNHIKDSIQAILQDKDCDNFYYLRESGAYRYGNVLFGVSSLIDKQHIYAKDIMTNAQYKIGLYHGGVGKTETSVGYKLNGDKLVSDFEGYDYVLLGDIHKYQYVAPNMAYSSSLISQNFGETDDYHGILIWDLNKGTQKYHIIKNKYRYMEIVVKENKVLKDGEEIDYKTFEFPKNGRLRVNVDDDNYYKDIKKYLRKNFKKLSIYESNIVKMNFEDENMNKEDISYISLLEKYITKLSEDNKGKCREIFSQNIVESELVVEKSLLEWKLLDLEFSNLFSYGSNNFIDFTKLQNNELTGLFAPNSYGKSTIIDILLFSLYEDFSRNVYSRYKTIPSYIINYKYNDFEIKLRFIIGGYLYMIHKKGKKVKKNTSKTGKSISFSINKLYRYEDGIETDLTGKDRFETLDVLKNIIGNYNEFCLTTLYLQNNEKNFYDMKPQDRKTFLYDLLHLHKFEYMTKKFKAKSRENKILLNNILSQLTDENNIDNLKENNTDYENEILLYEKDNINTILKLNELIQKKEKLLTFIDNDLLNIECKYSDSIDIMKYRMELIEKLIPEYNNYTYDFNEFKNILLKRIYLLESKIVNINDCYIDKPYNELIKELANINNILKNKEDIINKYNKYIKNKNEYDNLKYKLDLITQNIKENEINEKCKICMKRKCIIDKLLLEYEEINNKLKIIVLNDDDYKNYQDMILLEDKHNYIKNKTYEEDINRLNQVVNMIDYLHNIEREKDTFIIDTINNYKESIRYNENKSYIEEIKHLNVIINELNNKIIDNNSKITEYKLLINNNNFILNNYEKNITLKENYNNNVKIYDALAKSVCIHGIPSVILNKYLEGIQTYMNNLISPFINKTVELILEGNYLYINIYNDKDEIINILGGMEHFIVNISLKITLGKLSVLPKCGLLIIDEGVSVLDKEHIDKFHIIGNFLKSNYKNIIIISHIDGIKDFISDFISINKVNGDSIINY
jgi:DNA repair exonuclease SbcCD ATPase subunit